MTSHAISERLVCAWRLDGQGGGDPLTLGDETPAQGGFDWIHLDASSAASAHWLREKSGLPDYAADALLAGVGESRPRFEEDGDAALINLRGVNHNPGADPEDMVSIRIWATAERVITTRRFKLMAIQDLRAATAAGKGPATPSEMIGRIAYLLSRRIEPVIAELNERVDDCEVDVFETQAEIEERDLTEIRFEAVQLRRYISPQREALRGLSENTLSWFADDDRRTVDEAEEAAARVMEELDSIRDRAGVLHDMVESAQTRCMNRHTMVLSIIAGIFLPLGLVAGMFGMNVGGIPLAENPNGFWILSGYLALIGVLELALFKWARWI